MGKANKPAKNGPSKGKKQPDINEMKKVLSAKEKELEEKFSRYEELVKKYAEQQSSGQQQRDTLEELTEAVKKHRLRCRTLQCDAILVANENELLKKKVEIVENKVKTLKEKVQAKNDTNATKAEKKTNAKGKGGKLNKGKAKVDHEMLKEIGDVEEVALDLKQEVADKTRSLYMRTGDITPFMVGEQKTEESRALSSNAEGAPRSA